MTTRTHRKPLDSSLSICGYETAVPAGRHMYCTVTALFPLMKTSPLSPCGPAEKRGAGARMDLSCCQATCFWCQVSGQRPAPHAGLRYGHHSQSCHHPHAIVTKDAAFSCRGQQHPARDTSRGQNCPANESQPSSFSHTGLIFHGSTFVIP